MPHPSTPRRPRPYGSPGLLPAFPTEVDANWGRLAVVLWMLHLLGCFCAFRAVPTNGREARPAPRRNTHKSAISTSKAIHSSRSSLRNTCAGEPASRNTNEINAELVEMAEEMKTAPSTLLRDHSGTLVA